MKLKKILKIIKSRFFIFGVIITVMFSVLGLRLAYLTVEMGETYYNKAQETKIINITLRGERGSILDRNGIPLATNRQTYAVQVDRQWLPATDSEINEVLELAVSIIDRNGDELINSIPIKYGIKVYEDAVPYAVEGFYYDFGTSDVSVQKERYDRWRNDAKIEVDLPAEEMLRFLRQRYKIDDDLPDVTALKIISIRLDLYMNRYRQNEPVIIAEDVSSKTMAQLETYSDKLPGVQTTTVSSRYYPYGTSAQHIVGFVGQITGEQMDDFKSKYGISITEAGYSLNSDIYGRSGIEAYAEKWLTGSTVDKHGSLTAEVNALRQVIKILDKKPPKNGDDIILTIDSRLQKAAENVLREETAKIREGIAPYNGDMQSPEANTGAIVILDVNTGEILAMASYANSVYTYDLNTVVRDYAKLERDPSGTRPLLSNAFQSVYTPGSTFKMIVGIAALEEGIVTVNDRIYDRYKLTPNSPACWSTSAHGVGSLNLLDAIKASCNYYFSYVGYKMGIDTIYEWAVRFGLEGPLGLELPTTDNSRVAHPSKDNRHWTPELETTRAAIGQSSTQITPLRLARYIAAIANGGKVLETHVVKEIRSQDGKVVKKTEPVYTQLDIKQKNLDAIKEGMHRVVYQTGGPSGNSSVIRAFRDLDPNITLAGKTGTAQVTENAPTTAWFAMFTPYEKPEVVIVVTLPNGGASGNAVNVARRMLDEYYRLKNEELQNGLPGFNDITP